MEKAFDHKIRAEVLEKRHNEAGRVETVVLQCNQREADYQRGQELVEEFGASRKAEIAPVNDFQVVVGESDSAKARVATTAIQTKRLLRSAHNKVGTTVATTMSTPPMVGVPALR